MTKPKLSDQKLRNPNMTGETLKDRLQYIYEIAEDLDAPDKTLLDLLKLEIKQLIADSSKTPINSNPRL